MKEEHPKNVDPNEYINAPVVDFFGEKYEELKKTREVFLNYKKTLAKTTALIESIFRHK